MIEASPSRCTPEQWTAEQAARAMGVVDEAAGEALGVEGAAVGEIGVAGEVGREQPNAGGSRMRWVAGGTALAVVAAAAWWSGAGNRDSREIPVHAGADGALIAGERTPNSGPGDFNSSNGSSHMKIQTTAAAALLGAAAGAFQAQAGDAVQWRVEDGGNGHWYGISASATTWATASASARSAGAWLADIEADQEDVFIASLWATFGLTDGAWAGGYQANESCGPNCGWAWSSGKAWGYTNWYANEPNDVSGPESRLEILPVNSLSQWFDAPDSQSYLRRAVIEWSADCNSDGIVDYGQCHDGTLPDYNGNNIPDCCEQGVQCTVGNYPVQWRVEDGGNGHWYQAVHPSPMPTTFAAQDAFADSVGAHMATLTSSDENVFAISLLSGAAGEINGAHFGLRRVGDTTSWQWVGGEQLTWDFWGSISCSGGPYPNNSGTGGEMGAMLYKQNCGWVWDDAWPSYYAGELTLMLLIEWSADCNNDNIVDYGQILNGILPDTNTNNIPDCCEPGNSCCLGDIYENHIVDGGDLGVLLSEWGVVTPTTRSDLNRDGFVDGADLGRLLANWGPCGG
jgi:hypothetical protein